MIDDPWFLRPNEGKIMVDSMNRSELLRLTVRWPLAIETETGVAHGETTNMTGEGSLEMPQKKGRSDQYANSVMKARPKMAPSFLMVQTINCVIDRLEITNRVLSACIRNSSTRYGWSHPGG